MQAKVDAAAAEGGGRSLEIEVDSAGTGGWHRGEPADERARAEARSRGIELTSRARQVHVGDFAYFDLLVAMDRANHADLLDLAPDPDAAARVRLLLEFASHTGTDRAEPARPGQPTDLDHPGLDVPDPDYGGPTGFADVFDLIDDACDGLLAHVLLADPGRPTRSREPGTPDEPVPPATRPTSLEGQEAPES